MGTPGQVTGDCYPQVLDLSSHLKYMSIEGVVMMRDVGFPLACYLKDIALGWMEFHLPEVPPRSESIKVPLKPTSVTLAIQG